MAWTSARQVADVLRKTYLGLSSTTEDYRLLDTIVHGAINVGDSLAEIVDAHFRFGGDETLCLAAVVLLEKLIENGWKNCESFSDKPAVLHVLRRCVEELAPMRILGKCEGIVIRCFGGICVSEFPSPFWVNFLSQCVTTARDDTASSCAKCLLVLASLAAKNVLLWRWFCSEVVPQLNFPEVPCLSFGLLMMSTLFEKRAASSQLNDVIPTRAVNKIEKALLSLHPHKLVEMLSSGETLQGTCEFVVHCHVVTRATLIDVSNFLSHTMCCLDALKCTFLVNAKILPQCVVTLVVELLETVQSIFSSHEGLLTVLPPATSFSLLLWFTVNVDEEDTEETVMRWIADDDTVLAGCASGDACELSCSIIQQLIEFDDSVLPIFADVWCNAAENADRGKNVWLALANSLNAASRQCSFQGVCMLDVLSGGARIMEQIWIALKTSELSVQTRYLHVISSLLELSHDVSLCRVVFHFAAYVAQNSTQQLLQCVAIFSVARVLCSSTVVMNSLSSELSPEYCSNIVRCCSLGPLGVQCGIYAMTIVIELSDACAVHLWHSQMLEQCVRVALQCCTRNFFLQRVIRLLRELWESHSTLHECRQFSSICSMLVAHVRTAGRTAAAARCILDVTQYVAVKCRCNCGAALNELIDFVREFVVHWGPHDDATLRCLSSCLGSCLAAPLAERRDGLWPIASCLVEQVKYESSATFSVTALALGLSCVQARGFSSENLLQYCSCFCKHASHSKDFNLVGAILPFAATLVFHPERFFNIVSPKSMSLLCCVFSWWTSICVHCDRRTQHYTLAAWATILGQAGEWCSLLESRIPFHKIQSVHRAAKSTVMLSTIEAIGISVVGVLHAGAGAKLANFASNEEFHVFDLDQQVPGAATMHEIGHQLIARFAQNPAGPSFEHRAINFLFGES